MNYLKQFKFVKENSSFRHSQVLSFLSLPKSCPTKFKPLSAKLEKEKNVIYQFVFFLLNQMNCEIITEGKLGVEDETFHIYIMFPDNIWAIY